MTLIYPQKTLSLDVIPHPSTFFVSGNFLWSTRSSSHIDWELPLRRRKAAVWILACESHAEMTWGWTSDGVRAAPHPWKWALLLETVGAPLSKVQSYNVRNLEEGRAAQTKSKDLKQGKSPLTAYLCNHCKYNDIYNDKDENKGDDNDTDEDSDKDKGQGQGKSSLAELICEITSWQIDATIAQSRSASPTTTGAIMFIRTTVELSPCAEKLRLQQIIHSVDSTLSCSNSYTRVLVPRVKHLSSRLGSISEIGHVPILAGGARTRNENNPLKLPSRWQGSTRVLIG